MIKRILIIGGYGNFGSHIARSICDEENIQLIIAGRDLDKAKKFSANLGAKNKAEFARLDIDEALSEALALIKPNLVIHTSGPYQGQSYKVAQACIKQGCNYVDLADARDFVANITSLDIDAKKAGVLICSGASSVPCLTSGVIDKYIGEFSKLQEIEYAIATAQLTNGGLATAKASLSYAGKPFTTLVNGKMTEVFGWLGLKSRKFWGLNQRLLCNCDIPDLAIFPARYPTLKTIIFKAGLELKILHLILTFLSALVRLKIIKSLQPWAKMMVKISFLFDPFGKSNSGFYMIMKGLGKDQKSKEILFEIFAQDGDGLYIPSMPAILISRKFAHDKITAIGATPCVDIITLDEYLDELSKLKIQWRVS
jgi:saccharopine dehydrogenase-like NADP-dependent oxidoreductase